ncbi:hypothetical protein BD309DRAFT_1085227 [Dichomitus squalens]|nr:hypothetical protein BD309DRAFT_1085227 [Dichomitus squalens]
MWYEFVPPCQSPCYNIRRRETRPPEPSPAMSEFDDVHQLCSFVASVINNPNAYTLERIPSSLLRSSLALTPHRLTFAPINYSKTYTNFYSTDHLLSARRTRRSFNSPETTAALPWNASQNGRKAKRLRPKSSSKTLGQSSVKYCALQRLALSTQTFRNNSLPPRSRYHVLSANFKRVSVFAPLRRSPCRSWTRWGSTGVRTLLNPPPRHLRNVRSTPRQLQDFLNGPESLSTVSKTVPLRPVELI